MFIIQFANQLPMNRNRYMAPEAFLSGCHQEARSHPEADIYSFGMICFYIFTGRSLFSDITSSYEAATLASEKGLRPSWVQEIGQKQVRVEPNHYFYV